MIMTGIAPAAEFGYLTTTEAATYLTDRGYTVRSKRDGTNNAPPSELIKRWCERGKIAGHKTNWAWLVPIAELDRLIDSAEVERYERERRAQGRPMKGTGDDR